MITVVTQRAVHDCERRALVRRALVNSGWRLGRACEALGVGATALQRLIDKCGLRSEYTKNSPGRGRPRKEV